MNTKRQITTDKSKLDSDGTLGAMRKNNMYFNEDPKDLDGTMITMVGAHTVHVLQDCTRQRVALVSGVTAAWAHRDLRASPQGMTAVRA
jgi:hypothetical protein